MDPFGQPNRPYWTNFFVKKTVKSITKGSDCEGIVKHKSLRDTRKS